MVRSRRSNGPQWEHADDIPMDAQDEFLENRDHIALGSATSSRTRAQQLDDEDDAVHEVFCLQTEQDDEEDDDLDDEEDEDEEMVDVPPPSSRKQKKAAKAAAKSAQVSDDDSDSDESVSDRAHFGRSKRAYYASTNALDSASEAGSDGATTDEENELSPEQRRQMELREVRKMATAARKGMVERDFGLEDELELAAAASGSACTSSPNGVADGKSAEQRARERRRAALLGDVAQPSGAATEQAQNVHVALPTDPEMVAALLRNLHAKDALTLALAGEFADSVYEWGVLEAGMEKAAAELPPTHPSFSLMHIYQQTFLTYLTTLTFYFYLRTSPAYSPLPSDPVATTAAVQKLRRHPVVARLIELKEALANMEDLGFRVDQNASSEADDDELAPVFRSEDGDSTVDFGDLEDGELDDLLADEKENMALSIQSDPAYAALSQPEEVTQQQPKRKKAPKSAAEPEKKAVVRGPLAELDDLVSSSAAAGPSSSSKAKRKASTKVNTIADAEAAEALGELTSLTAAEKAEKQERKRSLRFYTGQIASRDPLAPSSSSMASRSGSGKAGGLSGDADIPYTDRERSRRAVEAAAEAKRLRANGLGGLSSADTALDGAESWGAADEKAWVDVMGVDAGSRPGALPAAMDLDGGDGGDDDAAGYYDLVATAKQERRQAKQDAYDEARLEERYQPDDTLEDGEHRALNRTIEKNRGLTPHRPKTVRNPRVKKRLKYESAKKKLSSSRPVYKGGQSSLEGGYGGEKSGISEGIVRSRSFS
ncbi:hypothetical protein V8E36_009511 [Tilletia maclaganii]